MTLGFMGFSSRRLRLLLLRIEIRYSRGKIRFKRWLGILRPIRVDAYRGYGGAQWCWLRGRVLEDKGLKPLTKESGAWQNLSNMLKRYTSDEIPVTPVQLELGGRTWTTETDEEGYYEFHLQNLPQGFLQEPVTEASISLPGFGTHEVRESQVKAIIKVVPEDCRFGVISDIDDTILETGATGLIKHLRTVLFNNAQSRVPFTGVSDFYRALSRGRDGQRHNPVFYVSSSPWNIYDLLDEFMAHHDIPAGPILLKDFGLHEDHYFKSSHHKHKLELIQSILDAYPSLSFMLIGDTGQQDAMIYEQVVRANPDRINAVYLREIHNNHAHKLAEAKSGIERYGVPVLFMSATDVAARHAELNGWITQEQRQRTERAVIHAQ